MNYLCVQDQKRSRVAGFAEDSNHVARSFWAELLPRLQSAQAAGSAKGKKCKPPGISDADWMFMYNQLSWLDLDGCTMVEVKSSS